MLCMSDFLCIINKLEGIFSTKKFKKYQKTTKVNIFSTKNLKKILVFLNRHEKTHPSKKGTHALKK